MRLTKRYDEGQLVEQYLNFSKAANCSDPNKPLACLRNQPSSVLQKANVDQICSAPYHGYRYGPAVDKYFVLDLPGREMLVDNVAKGVNLLIGHNG